MRIMLVCPLVNDEEVKGRRIMISRAWVEGCETLTMTIPIPIAVNWKKEQDK